MIQHIGVDACLNPEKFDVLLGLFWCFYECYIPNELKLGPRYTRNLYIYIVDICNHCTAYLLFLIRLFLEAIVTKINNFTRVGNVTGLLVSCWYSYSIILML